MTFSKMTLSIAASGKAPTNTSLQEVQNEVAKALRGAGVVVNTTDVRVEGRLA